MKIRNIEVDFDFLDADDVERFEKEAQKVVEKSENSKIKSMSHSDAIRKECKIIDDFFDSVFGEGTSEKIFKGKMNLREHISVFGETANQKNKTQNDLQQTFNKYQPNREQRRYNKYHRGKRK